MNEDLQKTLFDLSSVLMLNERREAEAVEGYNAQLKLIAEARDKLGEEEGELTAFFDGLEAATREKISDELNHGESLYAEYVQMMVIQPAKDQLMIFFVGNDGTVIKSFPQQLNNGAFAARAIYACNSTYGYGTGEITFYPDVGQFRAFVKINKGK